MTLLLNLLLLLLALCSAADPTEMHQRQKRGARNYSRRVACVDTDSAAVRDMGASWLRWKGPKVEFCRCAKQGRVRCHEIQVTTCLMSKCYNGGTCKKAVISSDFICQCPPGFTGTQCEINTGEHCVRGQGLGYRGNWSMSMSGLECVNWNSSSLRRKKFTARRPEANTLGLGNHNHCRNPDGDTKPWCYVYKKAQLSLEFCSVPTCITDPYLECVPRSGRPYRGTKSVTRRGLKCLPWDSPAVSHKIYNAWRSDARKMGLGSHNFCRNPDNERGPWCHVYKGSNLTWELCGVPKCPRRMLGPRAHVTTNNQGSCGQRIEVPLNSLPTFRIRHGQVSDIREQPWQAAITVYQPRAQSYSFLCGGVLIDSCWILSAAHCFYETRSERFEEKRLRVVLGRTFRRQNSSSEQIFDVEKYWIHEQYKHDYNFDNDIALLKLKSEFGICAIHSPEVLPACLPDPNLVFPGWKECEISGYGKEEEFSSFISERIKRGMVRLWPQTRCVPEKLSGHQVTSNMLCAGDTRGLDDTCKGDSGGPLVCKKNGRMTLMGLTSWGDGCGKKDKPGVYTRVTNYLNWISSKTSAD